MNDPRPPDINVKPSASTVASAVGAGLSAVLFIILNHFKFEVDAVSASVISGAISAASGWFFSGGRASDTE